MVKPWTELSPDEIIDTIIQARDNAKKAYLEGGRQVGKNAPYPIAQREMDELLEGAVNEEHRQSIEQNYIVVEPLDYDDYRDRILGKYMFDTTTPRNRAERRRLRFGNKLNHAHQAAGRSK